MSTEGISLNNIISTKQMSESRRWKRLFDWIATTKWFKNAVSAKDTEQTEVKKVNQANMNQNKTGI